MNKRVRYLFTGMVQGVGFRPFIYRTAKLHNLAGLVQNRSDGVRVEVEGPAHRIEAFLSNVLENPPPLARISSVTSGEIACRGEVDFSIIESDALTQADVHISPDIATCGECVKELFDPGDRRYRYPFINCTNCGPRLTIISDVPYDRSRTSMSRFPLCSLCRKEYENPLDRRFHAEPNACPECGPRLQLLQSDGSELPGGDPVTEAVRLLREGMVVAVKGIGGFHLAVNAANGDAVERLRIKKNREEKPFALMVRDIESAGRIALLDDEEKKLLQSPERPILLVRKKPGAVISPAVSPGLTTFGIMLPYTPLHHLLLNKGCEVLVMTSANEIDEPICIGNNEAVKRLSSIADYFLVHNRDILVRCDDSVAVSVMNAPYFFRRSRGYAPAPLLLHRSYPAVLALGAHLKATVCVLRDSHAFLSPHIGDLSTPQARDFLHETVTLMRRIAASEPGVVACDLHPDYYSTRAAFDMEGVELLRVQHHHAHVVSCMADNGITGRVIGLAMDGTGYGEDGTVWGGEFLIADECAFTRAGHIHTFILPGGEAAIREPWRVAMALLREHCGDEAQALASKLALIPDGVDIEFFNEIMRKKVLCPATSSMGRIFDAAAAVLGFRSVVNFEAQAAMEMEAAAESGECGHALSHEVMKGNGAYQLHLAPLIAALAHDRLEGVRIPDLARAFHRTIAEALADVAGRIRIDTGLDRAVLSGGCFQNRILLRDTVECLRKNKFKVFYHRRVPANDGGIALGQAVSAGARKL
ncbi:MAG: carbamoyltransferase HypF [Deltaproteobacteria bacterium]|nr:carbamoyltransferase HypF [Deltaproteobacteria bacterium]